MQAVVQQVPVQQLVQQVVQQVEVVPIQQVRPDVHPILYLV